MNFTKMQGIGNDYIYVNSFNETVNNSTEAAIFLSDRHFGVGGDGLVLIGPSQTADFKMSIFNADGSEAEMCGNAIRCVGKYVYDNKLTDKKEITIETLSGIKKVFLFVNDSNICTSAKVNMGEPILDTKLIPVIWDEERLINQFVPLESTLKNTDHGRVMGKDLIKLTSVSMGNPHAVIFLESMEELEELDIEKEGPKIENSKLFPNRTNTEFIYIIDRNNIRMRVWERGSGETLACGTGACAALVASVLNGYSDRKATVQLNGGNLLIEWDEASNSVFMTGPCEKVFDGSIDFTR